MLESIRRWLYRGSGDEINRALRLRAKSRQLMAIGLIAAAGYTVQWGGCNSADDPNDVPSVDAGAANTVDETAAERNLTKHCRGRYRPLHNYRHEGVRVFTLYTGWVTIPLYTAGSWHQWCWYEGGRIYWRNSGLKSDVTSPYNGVSLSVGWWGSSFCSIPKSSGGCYTFLYRAESHARVGIGVDVPVLGHIELSANQYRCYATAIRASFSDPHHRVIENGACPVGAAALEAVKLHEPKSTTLLTIEGVGEFKTGDRKIGEQLLKAIMSPSNLQYMKTHHGQSPPKTKLKVKQLSKRFLESMSPVERRKLLGPPRMGGMRL